MENASKALLIAAAVLVVIIMIAVGMKIYSSTTGTQKVATDTGTTINDKTKTASDMAISEITGKPAQSNPGSNTSGQKIGNVITKDNYGDYIELGQNVVGTSSSADDWRILYNDKAGHVYAILADYLPSNNPAVIASGLNVVSGKTYNVNSTSRNDLLAGLNHATAWNSLVPSSLISRGTKVKGAVTGEILMASYNEKYNPNPPKVYTSYPYLRTNPNDSSSSIDTLYMPHPGDDGYNGCYGYWLASPRANDYVWYVYCNGRVGHDTYSSTNYGVCPVVSLPSDIQVTKNGTVWTVVQ